MWEVILLTGAFGFFAADGLVRLRLRAPLRRTVAIFDYHSLAALVTAALLIYLTYALLRPERFCASDGQGRRQGRKALAQEYDRLRALMQHAGKVLTHKFLLGELWDHLTDAEFLRVYVRQLRRRSRPIPSDRNSRP